MEGPPSGRGHIELPALPVHVYPVGIPKALRCDTHVLSVKINYVRKGQLKIFFEGLSPFGPVPVVVGGIKTPWPHRDEVIGAEHQRVGYGFPVMELFVTVFENLHTISFRGMVDHKKQDLPGGAFIEADSMGM